MRTTPEQAFSGGGGKIESAGLHRLESKLEQFRTVTEFQQVIEALPEILSNLRGCTSITIGVNLDEHLNPEEAVLLAVNSERFTESSLLDRLLGKGAADGKGIAALHTLPMLTEISKMITGGLPISGPARRAEPMMVPLFRTFRRY